MYQSDVVVAGFKGTTCFAKDFYLSAYQECGEPKGALSKLLNLLLQLSGAHTLMFFVAIYPADPASAS